MSGFVFKSSALALSFAALSLFVYTLVSAPLAPANHLGVRGLKRTRTQQLNPVFREIEPVLRWLGVRLRPFLSDALHARIDRQITLAGDFWGLLPEECCALYVLSTFGGLGLGVAYAAMLGRGGLYMVLGVVVGLMLPYLQLSGIQQERRKQIQNGLPYVIDLLSLGLSAGLDFPGALRQVVEKSSDTKGALVEEIQLVLQELQVGKTRRQALDQFAQRNPGESVREFVGAVVQADIRGNPLGPVLEIQAEVSRQHRSVRAEESAARASVKMLLPMLLVFGAILLLIAAPMAMQVNGTFKGD
ncbi:MAG TPA: type II secretion system F family protein [Polyangiaceae bacterium]|nr:type II secretion system F family protein [Polyangiaceae bacterium]